MPKLFVRSVTILLAALVGVSAPVLAQGFYPEPAPAAAPAPASQEELDALVAPIALYPDQLLAQVLMAATFPLDVVEAARFVREHPELRGPALDGAIAGRNWDPSVLSLAAFPQILDMMNERLDWTRRLGDVFLADEGLVMQAVQDLRARAQAEGSLLDTPQQRVLVEDRAIVIEPARPDVVYVPVYDPTVVYGPWWAPAYVPFYWRPPRAYYPGVFVTAGVVGFGLGYAISNNHWHWARPDWHSRHIALDFNRPNRFIERRPQYRDWMRDGTWRQGDAWRGQGFRDGRGRDAQRPPSAQGFNRERNASGSRGEFRGDPGRTQSLGPPRAEFRGDSGRTPNLGPPRAEFRGDAGRPRNLDARGMPRGDQAGATSVPPATHGNEVRSFQGRRGGTESLPVPRQATPSGERTAPGAARSLNPRVEHARPENAAPRHVAPVPSGQAPAAQAPAASGERSGAPRGERKEAGPRGGEGASRERGPGPRER